MAWLRTVAAYEGWDDLRTVARASRVDMIGGRFVLPFPPSASYFEMPIAPFGVLRDLERGNAFRIRYYLETGRGDSAVLGLSTCTSPRGLLRGPRASVRETFDTFLATEAQWASDTAMVAMLRDGPLRTFGNPDRRGLASAAAGALGRLLGAPYLPACVRFFELGAF